jgi:hypothetical protein
MSMKMKEMTLLVQVQALLPVVEWAIRVYSLFHFSSISPYQINICTRTGIFTTLVLVNRTEYSEYFCVQCTPEY